MAGAAVQRKSFAVKVYLPKDITAILLCDQDTKVDRLLERSLEKLKTLLGISLEKSGFKVVSGDNAQDEIDLNLRVVDIPSVEDAFASNRSPCVRVKPCPPQSSESINLPSAESTTHIYGLYADGNDPEENGDDMTSDEDENLTQAAVEAAASRTNGDVDYDEDSSVNAAVRDRMNRTYASVGTDTRRERKDSVRTSITPRTRSLGSSSALQGHRSSVSSAVAAERQSGGRISIPSLAESDFADREGQYIIRPVSAVSSGQTDFSPNEVAVIEFIFPNKSKLTMQCACDATVQQIKQELFSHPELDSIAGPLTAPEGYTIRYISGDKLIELFDEDQIIQTISAFKVCRRNNIPFQLHVFANVRNLSKQTQHSNKKIGNLISFGLFRFDFLKDPEVDHFRRKMVGVRRDAISRRDTFRYLLEPNVDFSPLPDPIRMYLAQFRGKLQMRLHLKFIGMVKTLTCNADETPDQLIRAFIPKNKLNLPADAKSEDYIMKVCGAADFFTGEYRMIDYKHIRMCLFKNQPLNLALVERNKLNIQGSMDEIFEEFDIIEDTTGKGGSHAQLTVEGRERTDISRISLWDITRPYRIQVVAGESLSTGDVESLYVEVGIYHGGQPMAKILRTEQVRNSRNPRWNNWLIFDIATNNLPRSARLCITVYGRWNAKKKMSTDKESDITPIGWVNLLLMDFKGHLRSGMLKLTLWPGEKANPIGTCVSSRNFDHGALYLRMDTYAHHVIYPTEAYTDEYRDHLSASSAPNVEAEGQALEAIITSDPLTKLDRESTRLVWMYRFYCLRRPEALPKVLLSARWNVVEDVIEVRKLLKSWAPMSAEAALELLDANFGDEYVRAYAVSILETLSDDSLLDYLLQLVQVIKYEPYHDCALSRFLLRRALNSRIIGHHFFWYLRSEIDEPEVSLRFALLLEAYLRGCGTVVQEEIIRQVEVLNKLNNIAQAIKRVKGSEEKRDVLMSELSKCQLPPIFQLALNPRVEAKQLITPKCKYMDSKKLPLWCVFENADPTGSPIYIIFKSGDDLRQDMLTLQMLRIMDKLWRNNSLDLRMTPYGCISTGHEIGMIEVVLNSETVSNIQMSYGGSTAAFKDQPLQEWIRAHNPDDKDYEAAVETFTLSCAGYCVATYVLGIGDRHNDNIMVSKSGHLFHIDFGHFLGNIKRKFGFKRERAPFVLTPDFVYVMGKKDGEQFKKFLDYCTQAYLILRRHANMFINLFAMMLSTGIPELKAVEDIYYLRDALCIGMSEEAAANEFRNLIFESLRLGWSTQLNWWLHNLAHSK